MLARPLLTALAFTAVVTIVGCGSEEPQVDTGAPAPTTRPADPPVTATPLEGDEAAGPVDGEFSGRIVSVDRDGPAVEVVEATIVTGDAATAAARAAGEIGADETWELDFYIVEGARRWVDIAPDAAVAVYDCTQACEHVATTVDSLLVDGSPYGGTGALFTFVVDGGRASVIEEIYTP